MPYYRAYAKVNLTLRVLSRRPDGFHELDSLVQSVSLHDELTVEPADGLTLQCDRAELENEENLAWRAAALLQRRAGGRGARLALRKRIPVAAGLGGGSADAAAVLRALAALWGLGLPPTELLRLAATLGSDVPFFLVGGLVRLRGRGERLEPLPDRPQQHLVLLEGPRPLATADVFREADRLGSAGPGSNDLEAAALSLCPELEGYRDALRRAGARDVRLTGSGPTLFTLCANAGEADQVHAGCAAQGLTAHLATTISRAQALGTA